MPYIGMHRHTTNTWKIMMHVQIYHIPYTGMPKICLDKQCHESFPSMVSNGKTRN